MTLSPVERVISIYPIAERIFSYFEGSLSLLELSHLSKCFHIHARHHWNVMLKRESDYMGSIIHNYRKLTLLDNFIWNVARKDAMLKHIYEEFSFQCRQNYEFAMFRKAPVTFFLSNDSAMKKLEGKVWKFNSVPSDMIGSPNAPIPYHRYNLLIWFVKSGHVPKFIKYINAVDAERKIGTWELLYR